MFEQESYNFEVPAEPLREGDLFYQYEVGTWKITQGIIAIFGVSALLSVALIGVLAQTNVLMAKSCDSPFVGRVCQVLDMAYVGTVLFGTDREYVDAAYERTDLEDAEITWIDQTGVPAQLEYPEGYFQLANPVQFAQQQAMMNGTNPDGSFTAPGIPINPTQGGTSLIDTPAIGPKYNPKAVTGKVPDSPFDLSDNDTDTATTKPGKKGNTGKGKSNVNSSEPDKDQIADGSSDPKVDATDPIQPVTIDKASLLGLVDDILPKWESKEIDTSKEFTVVLDAYLNPDGRFDTKKSKWDLSKQKGDPKMIETARQSVEALSQSGWLGYLRNLGVDKINLVLAQDGEAITAVITSGQKNPDRAKTLLSGFNGLIFGAKQFLKSDQVDERKLLEGATVSQEGKNFVLRFKIPKADAQEMIGRKLKEALAKKQQQPTPNGISGQTQKTSPSSK